MQLTLERQRLASRQCGRLDRGIKVAKYSTDAVYLYGRPMPTSALYTVAEAAYVADTDERLVNREIDAAVIRAKAHGRERLLGESCLYYLYSIKDMRTNLDKALRRTLLAKVMRAHRQHRDQVEFGAFILPMASVRRSVKPRLSEVDALREFVVTDPRIASGEPVIRGTRHRVYKIAQLAAQGVSKGEFRKEYDLGSKQVDMAILYARLHPRRGRPEREQIRRRDVTVHVSADR